MGDAFSVPFIISWQKWNDVYNPEKILTLLYVREKISNSRELGKKFLLAG